MQPNRPPAAQLLYDLGLEPEDCMVSECGPEDGFNNALYPPSVPMMVDKLKWEVPVQSLSLPLFLQCTALPNPVAAAAACTLLPPVEVVRDDTTLPLRCRRAQLLASAIAGEYNVNSSCMDMVYMSPSPYQDAFNEVMDIRKCGFSKHPTAGMSLIEQNGRLILAHMTPSTPGAKVPRWRTRLRGAWLIKIDGKSVTTIEDARKVFESLSDNGATSAHLLFAYPEVRPDISHRGLPIISSEPFSLLTHAQLNDRWEFSTVASHLSKKPTYDLIDSGEVLNVVTRVMRLTRGKLLKQHDWEEWQESEFLQLDQYNAQGIFGLPVMVDSDAAVFHSVWTYAIKAVDG